MVSFIYDPRGFYEGAPSFVAWLGTDGRLLRVFVFSVNSGKVIIGP